MSSLLVRRVSRRKAHSQGTIWLETGQVVPQYFPEKQDGTGKNWKAVLKALILGWVRSFIHQNRLRPHRAGSKSHPNRCPAGVHVRWDQRASALESAR